MSRSTSIRPSALRGALQYVARVPSNARLRSTRAVEREVEVAQPETSCSKSNAFSDWMRTFTRITGSRAIGHMRVGKGKVNSFADLARLRFSSRFSAGDFHDNLRSSEARRLEMPGTEAVRTALA